MRAEKWNDLPAGRSRAHAANNAGVLPDEYEQGETAAHQGESLPDRGVLHNRVMIASPGTAEPVPVRRNMALGAEVGRLARPTEAQRDRGFQRGEGPLPPFEFHPTGRRQ